MAAKSCITIPGWLKPKQNSGINMINTTVFVTGASDFATAHPQDFCSDFPNEMAIPKRLCLQHIHAMIQSCHDMVPCTDMNMIHLKYISTYKYKYLSKSFHTVPTPHLCSSVVLCVIAG